MIRLALALAALYLVAIHTEVTIPGDPRPRAPLFPRSPTLPQPLRSLRFKKKEAPVSLFEAQHQRVNQLLAEVREGVTLPSAAREELRTIVYQGANLVEQAQAALEETRNVKACARNSRDWDPRKITLLDPKPVTMP